MTAPVLADEAAEQLAGVFDGDIEAAVVAAMLAPLQRMADIVLDDGGPFATVFDRTITDPVPLAWGAQWAGVDPDGASEAELRDAAFVSSRWARGSVPAVRAAIQSVLTGDKNLRLYERADPADFTVDAGPYHLTIVTNTSETPGGSDSIVTALDGVLPAKVKLHIAVVDGQSWQDLIDATMTWQDVLTDYEDWQHVADDDPI